MFSHIELTPKNNNALR